jgi:hypothetical protein
MHMPHRAAQILAISLLATACGGPAPRDIVQSSHALNSTNGVSLNGVSLNGVSLNGVSLNGVSLNGVSLNGVSLNGVSLNGSILSGVSAENGTLLSGSRLIGVTFNGVLSDGSTLPMRLDDISFTWGANWDVFFYDVSYQSGDAWYPLCGFEPDGSPVPAIALAGTWDYSENTPTGGSWSPSTTNFTFGCRHTALAKCVEAGYKPWRNVSGTSLRSYHQACTRLIRADYCGNGRPWTLNGRVIDLYDRLNIQTDTQSSWLFEAEWTDAGARCLTTLRVIDLQNVFGVVDQCVLAKVVALGCGNAAHFSTGTILMNKYQSAYVLGLSLKLL